MHADSEAFKAALARITGLECWNVTGGRGAGSRVALDFGAKVPREAPLRNQTLPEAARLYVGEYALFVEDCAWRLDRRDGSICSWRGGIGDEVESGTSLSIVVGTHVEAVEVGTPPFDLALTFSNGVKLRLFCDCVDEDRDGDNYSVFVPGRTYCVGAAGELRVEHRD